MRKTRLIALLTVLGMVLTACGDDDAGDPADTTAPADDDGGPEVAACEPGETDGDLNFYNWTEYIDPDLISAFEDEHGVSVVEDFYDSNEAMLARIQAGAVYDVIVPSDYMVTIMVEEGLLAEIQRDAVPNLGNLDAVFADPAYDPGGAFSVAYQWGTTGLGVDLSIVGEDFEASWALVFDPELTATYPRGVSLLNDPRETMGAALKYLGYSLNSTSESELQEAADLIRDASAQIVAYDSDTFSENLVNGEVAVSHGFSGTYFGAFDDVDGWDDYAYVIPEEGGTLWVDNMSIPAAAEHPCTAHAFINFLLDAENGAALTNWNFYASPNVASEDFIDPDILEDDTIYPSDEVEARLEIIVDTGDFEINYTDFFAQARS